MHFFLLWMGTAFLLLTWIGLIIWKSYARERFRAKLIITFLLFVAVPTIPLTFIASSLLTGSIELLLPETIGTALDLSMDCLRMQITQKGEDFLERYPDTIHFQKKDLIASGIYSLGLYAIHPDTITTVQELSLSKIQEGFFPQEIRNRFKYGKSSRITEQDQTEWLWLYKARPDSMLLLLKYPVEYGLSESRRQIEAALLMVNTLSMIKESILQKKVIWALAMFLNVTLIVLAWMVSRRLSGEMTRPMQALVHGMEHVASGDFDHQVHIPAKDEFQYIIHRFNAMTQDLRDTHEKLVRAERMAAWQSVARQISHEIKNSLTPIFISLHRLKKQLGSSMPPGILESLQAIDEEMGVFQNMAEEFSSFARMPELRIENNQLNDIVQSACSLMMNIHENIRFDWELDPDLPKLALDRDQIKRMLNNLLKNAAEAMDGCGSILLKTESADDEKIVKLCIRDTGRGMDEDTMSRIFQPWFTTKPHGTGLGMAMVHQIVEAHQAEIHVESVQGKGTVITIRFPLFTTK